MVTMLAPALLWCLTMVHGKHLLIETEDQHGVAGAASEAGDDYNDYGHKGKTWDTTWAPRTTTWKTWDTTWAPRTTTPRRCFWGPWGVWSHINVTCGYGKTTRKRFCRCSDGSQPRPGTCGKNNKDTKEVYKGPCATPGPKPYLEGKRRKRF